MKTEYTVSLKKIIDEHQLEVLYMPNEAEKILITTPEINRPGLQMAGYFEFFDEKRIQIIGKSEEGFLSNFAPDKAEKRLKEFFEKKLNNPGFVAKAPEKVVAEQREQLSKVLEKIENLLAGIEDIKKQM